MVLLSFLKVCFGSEIPDVESHNNLVFCTKMGSESSSRHPAGSQGLCVATPLSPLWASAELYKWE